MSLSIRTARRTRVYPGRATIALVLVSAVAVLAPRAVGAGLDPPPPCPRPIVWNGTSGRVVEGHSGVGPTADRYLTVLPKAYRTKPGKRYPVIYLLHGRTTVAEEFLVCMRLLELSARTRAIVVLPEGTPNGYWIDWHSGSELRETALLTMIRAVDARFRTKAKASRRAIGGVSMGGYGAMVQAARHPRLFTAAASFSGVLGSSDPTPAGGAVAWTLTSRSAPGAFADPLTAAGRAWRAEHDPITLARRLRGMSLFLSAATGVPCDADELERFDESLVQPIFEPLVRQQQEAMHTALEAAGIAHVYRTYNCGAHTHPVFQRELEDGWPLLVRAIGADEPQAKRRSARRASTP